MNDETPSEALVALFESGSTVRVQQFLNDAGRRAGAGEPELRDERLRALDQIALIACQSVLYRQDEVYRLAVVALERAYNSRLLTANSVPWVGNDAARAQHYLDVLVRVLAIGALAVRREAWELLPDLSNRAVKEGGSEWPSWLRHAVTMASRPDLLQDTDGRSRGGQALSLARALVPGVIGTEMWAFLDREGARCSAMGRELSPRRASPRSRWAEPADRMKLPTSLRS